MTRQRYHSCFNYGSGGGDVGVASGAGLSQPPRWGEGGEAPPEVEKINTLPLNTL